MGTKWYYGYHSELFGHPLPNPAEGDSLSTQIPTLGTGNIARRHVIWKPLHWCAHTGARTHLSVGIYI